MSQVKIKPFQQGRFFEDFSLNEEIKHGVPRTITEGDVSLYTALTGSMFPIYCANTVAKKCGFERTPVDNFLVFHIAFGKTVPDISLNAVANLGYAEGKFLKAVYCGDTLSVSSEVIGLKENSNGKTGIVYVHSKAINQHNQRVAEWKRWVMIHKKQSGNISPDYSLVPDLKSFDSQFESAIPNELSFQNFESQFTASALSLNDYSNDDWIDHGAGMTINDSDHSLATRLYQNNARVHFDAHLMESTNHKNRLVYGGHIISMARAMSFNGLPNALWLIGINGGHHLNPSYAGDTIYCASQILNKGELKDASNMGWLRVRTVAFKNQRATEGLNNLHRENEQWVLDFDYTLLMPKNLS